MKPYYEYAGIAIYNGDALSVLKTLPDESVNCCVTSPPYWGLRDYGKDGQIGLEATPEAYTAALVAVFNEVRRVLRDNGTLWLNLGDSYSGSGKGGNPEDSPHRKQATNKGSLIGESARAGAVTNVSRRLCTENGIAPKNLIGIPWRVAFALQSSGWLLRSDIIWHKPNPMPESVEDRPTRSHEYIFLLSKSARYFYDADAIAETAIGVDRKRDDIIGGKKGDAVHHSPGGSFKQRGHSRKHAGFNERWDAMSKAEQCSGKRNKRDVWTVAPAQYAGAHFATFPEELIKPCIMAGCEIGGRVLDTFAGSGTTLKVARDQDCNSIGIELNPEYCELIRKRLKQEVFNFGAASQA